MKMFGKSELSARLIKCLFGIVICFFFASCATPHKKNAEIAESHIPVAQMSERDVKLEVLRCGGAYSRLIKMLDLARYRSEWVENSAAGFPVYRYHLSNGRLLFIKVEEGTDKVVEVFFVDPMK